MYTLSILPRFLYKVMCLESLSCPYFIEISNFITSNSVVGNLLSDLAEIINYAVF